MAEAFVVAVSMLALSLVLYRRRQKNYEYPKPSKLIHGAKLEIEDLDIEKIMGLYRESQVDVNDPDVQLWSGNFVHKGERLFYKKSEGKVVAFQDSEIKLQKLLKEDGK